MKIKIVNRQSIRCLIEERGYEDEVIIRSASGGFQIGERISLGDLQFFYNSGEITIEAEDHDEN